MEKSATILIFLKLTGLANSKRISWSRMEVVIPWWSILVIGYKRVRKGVPKMMRVLRFLTKIKEVFIQIPLLQI